MGSREALEIELYRAVRSNDTRKSLALLDEGVSCKYVDPLNTAGWTCLHWAAYHGNEKIVDALLSANAASDYKMHKMKTGMNNKNTIEEEEEDTDMPVDPVAVNTPLHRAAQQGHLGVCWLLLQFGAYSTDDIDNVGNTPLHLCAANGHERVLSCFIQGGADTTRKNQFHNTALDVATAPSCRMLLKLATFEEQNLDKNKRQLMHQESIQKYVQAEARILRAIDSRGPSIRDNLGELKRAIRTANEIGVVREYINMGMHRVKWLEMEQHLQADVEVVKRNAPIVTQTKYQHVSRLQHTLKQLEKLKISREADGTLSIDLDALVDEGTSLCKTSHAEYCLHAVTTRFEHVQYATEDDMGNIDSLRVAIQDTARLGGNIELLDNVKRLLARSQSEIDLQRACANWPSVSLPLQLTPKQKEEYWKAEDVGHIEQTEEYPMPPVTSGEKGREGEYIWNSSRSLQLLRKAISHAEECIKKAEQTGACDVLVAESKDQMKIPLEQRSALEQKDEEDRVAAVQEAQKAARKLKGKKKKKKNDQNT